MAEIDYFLIPGFSNDRSSVTVVLRCVQEVDTREICLTTQGADERGEFDSERTYESGTELVSHIRHNFYQS